MGLRHASIAGLIGWMGFLAGGVQAGTYPQLVSTRFEGKGAVPSGAERPRVAVAPIDRRGLPEGALVRATAKAASGRVWVLTDQGAFRSTATGFEPVEFGPRRLEPGQPQVRGGGRITALEADSLGHIWVGSDRGLFITNGEEWWQRLGGADGVPYEKITCLHIAPAGDVWAGTSEGAWRLRNGSFRYFWGKRWLCDNEVLAIWTDRQGGAWIETKTGFACIVEKPMTLAEKSKHYESIIEQRHDRRGFIAALDLQTPGDATRGGAFEISDNDGLWTSLYVAAMSLKFAVTKDQAARARAQKSLNALLDLERLSGIPGFPARAIVTEDELKAGAHGFNPDARVHAIGETAKAWYRSSKQPGLWCKGDTSSDELDGHYFAWNLYHDLVADQAERKEIAGVARRVTDGIIANHYTLVDHTGRKTRWGIWAPELINQDPRYAGLRPLNSLEILAYLKVAEHITGDKKYATAADRLIREHHYLINSLLVRRGEGAHWSRINHSDDELLYLTYYTLLSLEKDPARRRIVVESMTRTWEGAGTEQSIKAEHNPLYNFIYGAGTGRIWNVDIARMTLRDWPWELISWTTKNSQRHDVSVLTVEGRRRNRVQLDRVLSPAERSQARWNANPWAADWGSDGRVEDDGVAWLLAYWLGVYHGFLTVGE